MAQVPLEKKINMSYSAEELLVTCFFDGMSCDARSGEELNVGSSEPGSSCTHPQLSCRTWEQKVLFSLILPLGKPPTWERVLESVSEVRGVGSHCL